MTKKYALHICSRTLLQGFLMLFCLAGIAIAEDLPTFKLVFKETSVTPTRIIAPVGKRFKIELENASSKAVEFESLSLRKEKVLAPGVTSSVVINSSALGEHIFFDDFNPSVKGVIVLQ